jgi:hypothetical protein
MRRRGVYPMAQGAVSADSEDTMRSEIGRHFVCLQDYVGKMSDKGNGLLVWID